MKKEHLRGFRNLFIGLCTILILSCFVWVADTASETENNEPQLLSNHCRDDLKNCLLGAIKEAKKSIFILIYSLTDKQIIEALRHKSEEGIDVNVIYDAKASPYADRKLGPKVKILRRFGKGLMHNKILVVDEKKILMGSANFTNDSLSMHSNLMIAFENPPMARFILDKASTMEEIDNSKKFIHQEFMFGDQRVEFWFLPDDRKASLRIKELIRSAQKSIRVAMFTFTRYDFAKELVEARLRGVNLEVVMDNNSSKGASAKIAKFFQEANVPVLCNKGPGLLHHKLLYIDEKILVNGSANWTKAAFNTNDDCFVVIHDLSNSQKNKMNKLWRVTCAESRSATKATPSQTSSLVLFD